MSFEIIITDEAKTDIKRLRKTGNIQLMKKLNTILDELRENPFESTGKIEQLKYYIEPTYSRRLNKEHRIVYRIYESQVIVLILSCFGHYKNEK